MLMCFRSEIKGFIRLEASNQSQVTKLAHRGSSILHFTVSSVVRHFVKTPVYSVADFACSSVGLQTELQKVSVQAFAPSIIAGPMFLSTRIPILPFQAEVTESIPSNRL